MPKKKKKDESFTVCSKISDDKGIEFLREIGGVHGHVLRTLHIDLNIKEKSLNTLKADYQPKFGITSRHFNSVRMDLNGKWSARKEQYEGELAEKDSAIRATNKSIEKKQKEIDRNNTRIDKINSFRKRQKEYQLTPRGRKPRLTKSLKKFSIQKLKKKNEQLLNYIKMKKLKVNRLSNIYAKVKKRLDAKSLCFGGEALFKKQYHLKGTDYNSHKEWKEHWNIQRNRNSFWVGSTNEKNGNMNASYDYMKHELRLRAPGCLLEKYGKYVYIPVYFDEKSEGFLLDALKSNIAINFRFVEKIDTTRTGNYIKIFNKDGEFEGFQTSYYCHVSFEPPKPAENKTSELNGMFGVDFNADHLAITETDSSGNPVSSYSLPFDMSGKTSDQRDAVMTDHIANLCDLSLKAGKPIAIERLDFFKLKQNIKEKGKSRYYNRMISQFQYSSFRKQIISRARKAGVKIHEKNPCFTSVIGAYKFRGLNKLSYHHLAALVIARRALGYSERPKIAMDMYSPDRMDGLNFGTAHEFQSSIERKKKPRHIWSFYRFHTKKIRETMRISDSASVQTRFLLNPSRPSGLFATMEVMLDLRERESICRFLQDLDDWSNVRPASI